MTVVGTDDVAGEEGGPVGDAPLLLRPAEAAALLGIGRTKLYELLSSGRLASVGPAGGEVGLVAALEVGVTAALVAGAANWLIIRYHIRRLNAQVPAPPVDWVSDPLPPPPARASAPQPRASGPQPALIVDETDDAGGHRIHVNPWADDPPG